MPATSPKKSQTQREPRPLSRREREVMGMLAEGLSGAAIAEHLVLSPETIRTHVRNAMDKLGAATRSQAVAIALERGEIGEQPDGPATPSETQPSRATSQPPSTATLTALLTGIVSLADVDAAAMYTAEEGGFSLRLAAHASSSSTPAAAPPRELILGEGAAGRAALERRARLVSSNEGAAGPSSVPTLVSPMVGDGRLAGVLCLAVRASRPTSRRELLLLEAFGNRVAEVLAEASADQTAGLRTALSRFRASWTGTVQD